MRFGQVTAQCFVTMALYKGDCLIRETIIVVLYTPKHQYGEFHTKYDSAYYFTLDQSTQIVLCGADCMTDITDITNVTMMLDTMAIT